MFGAGLAKGQAQAQADNHAEVVSVTLLRVRLLRVCFFHSSGVQVYLLERLAAGDLVTAKLLLHAVVSLVSLSPGLPC
jgi:uncharacterized membrane protein